jgi:hypothetical protein
MKNKAKTPLEASKESKLVKQADNTKCVYLHISSPEGQNDR